MTATTAKCPDCNHLVTKHDEFFCMEINCMCNNGRKAALAGYERDVMKRKLDIAMQTLEELVGKEYPNGIPHSITAKTALDKIGEIE